VGVSAQRRWSEQTVFHDRPETFSKTQTLRIHRHHPHHVAVQYNRWRILRSTGAIIRKLDKHIDRETYLDLVHSQPFAFRCAPQLQTRDNIDGFGDGGCHDKGIGASGKDIGHLDVHLFPVLVDPSTRDASVNSVECDDGFCGKETIENEPDNATDRVLGKEIEGVINAEEEFDCNRSVSANKRGGLFDTNLWWQNYKVHRKQFLQ